MFSLTHLWNSLINLWMPKFAIFIKIMSEFPPSLSSLWGFEGTVEEINTYKRYTPMDMVWFYYLGNSPTSSWGNLYCGVLPLKPPFSSSANAYIFTLLFKIISKLILLKKLHLHKHGVILLPSKQSYVLLRQIGVPFQIKLYFDTSKSIKFLKR